MDNSNINNSEDIYKNALFNLVEQLHTLDYKLKDSAECESLEDIDSIMEFFSNFKLKNSFSENGFVKNFPNLFKAIEDYVYESRKCFVPSEFSLHEKFMKNLSQLIPGAILIDKKNDIRHKPDFWIKVNDFDCPVEIKRKNFTDNSKKQLLRYMNFYSSKMGFAVATNLKTKLPANIFFVELR